MFVCCAFCGVLSIVYNIAIDKIYIWVYNGYIGMGNGERVASEKVLYLSSSNLLSHALSAYTLDNSPLP